MKKNTCSIIDYSFGNRLIIERDIRLLKRRCIDEDHNVWDDYFIWKYGRTDSRKKMYIPVTKDQAKKGERWLYDHIWTPHHKICKNCPISAEMAELLNHSVVSYGLSGFDRFDSNGYIRWLPEYRYETAFACIFYCADTGGGKDAFHLIKLYTK